MGETDIIEGASRLLSTTTVETCGSCRFGHPIIEDLKIVECRGTPPTPVVMGMTQNGPAVGILRARLPRTDAACALWKFKSAIIL